MRSIKKNQKGMTLVEVVIAIAMFSVLTLAVTYAFSAALKLNARNMRRDKELATQQGALERASAAGVTLNDGNTVKGSKIVYSDGSGGTFGTLEVDDVTQYKAIKTAENGNDFNFELHTASATPFGSVPTKIDKDNGYYGIEVENTTSNRYDVIIKANGGRFYEGNYDRYMETDGGYTHPGLTYARSLEAKGFDNNIYDYDPTGKTEAEKAELQNIKDNSVPHSFIVGFYYDPAEIDPFSIEVYIRSESGVQMLAGTLSEGNFGTDGKVSFEIT